MTETTFEYCPHCGSPWNPWAENKEPVKCWSCGYERQTMKANAEVQPEPIPNHCEEHPHYAAKAEPKTDCLTCWTMYRGAVDRHIKSIGG